MQEHRSAGGVNFHQFVSNTTTLTSIAVPATVLVIGILHDDKATLKKALYITESIAVSTLISYTIKNTVNRTRPFNANPIIVPADGSKSFSPSFPSGHTSMAFSTATSLSIAYPKWYVIIPSYAWATTVAYSRMYLGVHYPTDVAAGALVGAGSAWLTYKANQWLQGKGKPKKVRTVY